MSAKKIFSVLLCAAMLFTAMPFYTYAEEDTDAYIPDEVLFVYEQTVADAQEFCAEDHLDDAIASCGVTQVQELPAGTIYDTQCRENADGTFTKTTVFRGVTQRGVAETCACLERIHGVLLAEPNYYLQADTFAMPTEITSRTSNYNKYTKWWMEDLLHIPDAWQQFETLGAGSLVAVLDTGLYVNNPEIHDNIWVDAQGHRGYNAVTQTYDIQPTTGHGGNVTGIVAAKAGGNQTLVGVAPEAKIIPIQIGTNAMSIAISAVVTGINYATSNGANVITMSLSTTSSSTLLQNACRAAYDAGIVVIGSAGNDAKSTSESKAYPGAYDTVLGVMALDKDGQLCSFSNYDPTGFYYNVAAPGRTILGLPYSESATGLSGYSGTSQAAPIIAGLAALYHSVYPDHTPEEFWRALLNTGTTCTSNSTVVTNTVYTYPVPDAVELLSFPDTQPTVAPFAGTTTVIDETAGFIYGMEEHYASIEDYVSVTDGSYELIPTENGIGTGSILRVYTLAGDVYRDYEIVIFGDTDGDAGCDGRDAALCEFLRHGGILPDCVRFAADVDFDDCVTETDSTIIARCGLFMDFVSQIR